MLELNESQATPESTVFYTMKLSVEEDGICIWTIKYISLKETRCMHFCVTESEYKTIKQFKDGRTLLERAKHYRFIKIRRINKKSNLNGSSRIASETKEEALKQLLFIKKREISHLQHRFEVLSGFFAQTEDMNLLQLIDDKSDGGRTVFPETHDLVHDHYSFGW